MMHTAEVKYDELNNLCVGIDNGEYERLLLTDAEINRFFRDINKVQFKSVRIHRNDLRLVNGNKEVVIRDVNRFFKEGDFERIPYVAKQVKGTIVKYNKERARRKKRRNVRFGPRQIVATSIVAGVLVATPFLAKALLANNEVQEQTYDDNNEYNFDSLIALDNIGTSVNYSIDDLKDELEESDAIQNEVEINETPLIDQITDDLVADIGHSAYLDYQLSTDTAKREYAYNTYHDLVERFSAKWGISFNLVMAMLTQESGGFETNLMQIEFDVWDEEIIKVYNFEAEKYDYFVLTNDPEKWADKNVTCITEKDLENPITNISIGCVLLRKSAEYMEYHVLAAVQCYNLGPGNMDKVLAKAEEETGQTRDEMLADQGNITFYQFTYIINEGDPNYLSNVFSFLSDYGETITFKHFGDNHEIVEEVITIFSVQQMGGKH